MNPTDLLALFLRDLDHVRQELQAYPAEALMWKTTPAISNSAGNLALHVAGNLQHFIGAVLGNSGYVRNRNAEFENQLPVSEVLAELEAAETALRAVLPALSPSQLAAQYPLEVFGKPMTTGWFLLHLQGHLNYHLGQINYHRRLLADA